MKLHYVPNIQSLSSPTVAQYVGKQVLGSLQDSESRIQATYHSFQIVSLARCFGLASRLSHVHNSPRQNLQISPTKPRHKRWDRSKTPGNLVPEAVRRLLPAA